MGLTRRLRSLSDVPRKPNSAPYGVRFERCLSAPDLSDKSLQLHELDKDAANLLATLYLEETERKGAHYLYHRSAKHYSCSKENSPPDYNLLAPLAPRYPILPREEEGKEKLPNYTPSITKSAVLNKKCEMTSPFMPAPQRAWNHRWVEVNNTQLNIYQARRGSQGTKRRRGGLLRSYTLQYAEIGLAVDYMKKPNVIRVRAEADQFLLECVSKEDCVVWMNVLQMAIDLALPLEERRLPKYRSIPRRRRRMHIQGVDLDAVQAGSTERTSMELCPVSTIASSFGPQPGSNGSVPVLTRGSSSSVSSGASSSNFNSNSNQHNNDSTTTTNSNDNNNNNNPNDDDDDFEPNDMIVADEDAADMDDTAEPADLEKWDPGHVPSYSSFLRYAQRCLCTLTADSSWTNKTIVIEGRKYVVRENAFERVNVVN